ncbi:MAG: hypothetical protein EA408_13535 [Marinilabiliales bacterium]|nr:MAG: hypothetical protein EA408_13535 [Marinilabiliales bacterium]
MRKLFLLLAIILATSGTGMAQGDQSGAPGVFAFELSMSPFVDSEAWLSPGFIKGRFFTGPIGVRLGLGTNLLLSSDQGTQPETVRNLAYLDIRPGVEYHLAQTGEVVAYAGLDFIFANRNANVDATVGAPITGAWDINTLNNRGFMALGANLVVGGEYYLRGGGFFIGTEIGFEFLYFTHHEVKWGDEVRIPQTNSTTFMPSLNSSLRLGVAF